MMPSARYNRGRQARGGVGIPQKLIQKKALALLLSLPQPMCSLILCIAEHSAL